MLKSSIDYHQRKILFNLTHLKQNITGFDVNCICFYLNSFSENFKTNKMESNTFLVIGVSGVTCGGKTTLANGLLNFFKDPANACMFGSKTKINTVKKLSQDDYFLPVDSSKHTIVEPLNHINWEIVSSLDLDRMCRDIMQILGNKFKLYRTKQSTDAMEIYDNFFSTYFTTNDSQRASSSKKQPALNLNILILEGFLLYNNAITLDVCSVKFHLHLPYEKCYDRRKNRIYDPPDVLGYFEMTVWPWYQKHFKEFGSRPDIVFLNAEVPKDKLLKFVLNFLQNSI